MVKARKSGPEGSCVGFAAAAALEYLVQKDRGKQVAISPRYIYYYARKEGGFSTDCDTGAHIQDAVKVLLRRGAVPEEAWPYKAEEFGEPPPEKVEKAEHYRVRAVRSLANVDELKTALRTFGPVVGGLCLFESVYSETTWKSGRIPMPDPDERVCGAAAVCFIGFDDTLQLLKFRIAWGDSWGDHGCGYVSYDYADKFLSDAWAVTL